MNPSSHDLQLIQCCVCLRVRHRDAVPDDQASWIRVHRRLPVSHGLCPPCADEVMYQLEQQTVEQVTTVSA